MIDQDQAGLDAALLMFGIEGDDRYGSAARRLDELIEIIAERVERRVLDDLERRGLRPGSQLF